LAVIRCAFIEIDAAHRGGSWTKKHWELSFPVLFS